MSSERLIQQSDVILAELCGLSTHLVCKMNDVVRRMEQLRQLAPELGSQETLLRQAREFYGSTIQTDGERVEFLYYLDGVLKAEIERHVGTSKQG